MDSIDKEAMTVCEHLETVIDLLIESKNGNQEKAINVALVHLFEIRRKMFGIDKNGNNLGEINV